MGLFTKWGGARRQRTKVPRRARLQVEALEARAVPTASGNAWPHPELVTVSFVPDGTNLGGQSSNLFSTFNAKFGSAATWQNQILKAAQQWAQQTNINFSAVSDSGADSGSGSYQQGDSTFGDIRVGGFNFGAGNNALAIAYMPPAVNNYSIAGNIVFNTGQNFNINGANFDLMTVAIHEMGHSLGLDHSSAYYACMYPTYISVRRTLNSDDVSVVRSIYSSGTARSADAYDAAGSNGSFLTATNITSQIDTTALTALVTDLDITTTSDADYYTFTAPAGTSGTMTVNAQSSGLSLLAPNLTVYNSLLLPIGSQSGSGQYGTTLSVTINGISEGQQFYVRVGGSEGTSLGTGKYGMTLNFGTNPSPTVPLPNTQTANGDPLQGGGGIADTPGKGGRGHGHGHETWDAFEAPSAVSTPGAANAGFSGVTSAVAMAQSGVVSTSVLQAVTPAWSRSADLTLSLPLASQVDLLFGSGDHGQVLGNDWNGLQLGFADDLATDFTAGTVDAAFIS